LVELAVDSARELCDGVGRHLKFWGWRDETRGATAIFILGRITLLAIDRETVSSKI
jgi:hypothetical protein